MNYNETNAHPRDTELTFDPVEHIYTHAGRTMRSVTTLVDSLFEQFDAQKWAKIKATPECPAEMLLQEWDRKGQQARDLGTLMHDRIERHYLGEPIEPEAESDPTFRLFRQFTAKRTLKPYRTEWRIFLEEHDLAGTLDFLGVGDDGEFEIWDWKRSSKIVDPATRRPITRSRYHKTAYRPIQWLDDCTFNHYALQVSIYRRILERKYGICPKRAFLGVFHPDYPTYHVVALPYLEREVSVLLP